MKKEIKVLENKKVRENGIIILNVKIVVFSYKMIYLL